MKHLLSAITAISFFWIAPAGAQDKLTIMLDWFVNPDHAPLIVAQEKGYFKSTGLKVKMIAPADPNDPPKLVAAGKVDLAVSYQPQLHVQVSGDYHWLDRTLVSTPLNSLVALAGPIKSIKDLKGKKVGFSVGGFEDALLAAMLSKHNLSIKDVELINVNFSLSPLLSRARLMRLLGPSVILSSTRWISSGRHRFLSRGRGCSAL